MTKTRIVTPRSARGKYAGSLTFIGLDVWRPFGRKGRVTMIVSLGWLNEIVKWLTVY
ncbi:hypothetical protein GA0061102_1002243 [Rhizobium miluonense]|uniref:Uncharacterized protein n=1 Tax=Rhizobium miluonense TaxID=411945 RepID=A0A1C3UAB7_9HYPH|nr:hypothetical protein GA0061102_1002243 [Rhizobium miluonense]